MGAGSTEERRASLQIRNKLGLQARAARLFVETANRFDAEVTVEKDGQQVNGRSIMGVMMLAAEQGSHINVVTTGREAAAAMEAIRELVDARFQEQE